MAELGRRGRRHLLCGPLSTRRKLPTFESATQLVVKVTVVVESSEGGETVKPDRNGTPMKVGNHVAKKGHALATGGGDMPDPPGFARCRGNI